MKLPFLISVPHAGLSIPNEIKSIVTLTPAQIRDDSDDQAAQIYSVKDVVADYISTPVARAIVDLNRQPDDFSTDGVIKTHTCQMKPVYSIPPDNQMIKKLLDLYYYPYHHRLRQLVQSKEKKIIMGLDCHTMQGTSPKISPRPGTPRPYVCLSNAGYTCPQHWIQLMAECFKEYFGPSVTINDPFKGGYITRTHGREMPWMQVEISRAPFVSVAEKKAGFINSISQWVEKRGQVYS